LNVNIKERYDECASQSYVRNAKGRYRSHSRNESAYWDEWVVTFHERSSYSVKPLYDAEHLQHVLLRGRQTYYDTCKELLAEGIDPEKCEYCGPDGCIIPWEERPEQCKDFRCWPWKTLYNGVLWPKDSRLAILYDKFDIPSLVEEKLTNTFK